MMKQTKGLGIFWEQKMSDNLNFPVLPSAKIGTHCTAEKYNEMYERSIADPEGFWGEVAGSISWSKNWLIV